MSATHHLLATFGINDKEDINKWDTMKWRQEMEEKSSLKCYRKWRTEIGGQENNYDNRLSCVFFKCRTSTLNLNGRKRFAGGNTACELCSEETENLEHFLLWCPEYQRERNENRKLQRPFKEDVEVVIG